MSCYSETYQGRNYNLQKSCCFLNSQANWRAHNSSPHKWYCHFRDWHNWYLTLLIKLKLVLVNIGIMNYWYWAQFRLTLLKLDITDLQACWSQKTIPSFKCAKIMYYKYEKFWVSVMSRVNYVKSQLWKYQLCYDPDSQAQLCQFQLCKYWSIHWIYWNQIHKTKY